ncbi:MAG: WecB/TagA/CpsF family glycosyltransferase [Sulfuriferula sp.]
MIQTDKYPYDKKNVPTVNNAGVGCLQSSLTDFYRPVYCLLGLPFDAIDMGEAIRRVDDAVRLRRRCFLSTPNLNFVIGSLTDAEFRDSVINSDLSVADGMPLVWISRMLGIPIQTRIAGSSLFEFLRHRAGAALSVYFYGGLDGVAKSACEKINAAPSGMQCVGFESPGFGTLEAISSDQTIAKINASNADFLVVALGAKKGQAWIEHNRARLRVPVISHLGAVVNFVAGIVNRAPEWAQRTGLEWLWRIKEEPILWRRYYHDGFGLSRLLLTKVFPSLVYRWLFSPNAQSLNDARISIVCDKNRRRIILMGAWCAENLMAARQAFEQSIQTPTDIELDFSDVTYVDSAFIAIVMLMYGHQSESGLGFGIVSATPRISQFFHLSCASFLLK